MRLKIKKWMALYIKDTKKDINMTEEDEEFYKNTIVCRFCEKEITSDEIRDQCHLKGKYRGPALSICNIIVRQKQGIFIPFLFHNLSNYDCHTIFKSTVE